MALMKCPECANKISDEAQACPHCGYPISESITEPPDVDDSIEVAPVKEESAAKSSVKTAIILFSIIGLIALCTAIIFKVNPFVPSDEQQSVAFAKEFIGYFQSEEYLQMSLMTVGSDDYISMYAGTTISNSRIKKTRSYTDYARITYLRGLRDNDKDWKRTTNLAQTLYNSGYDIVEFTTSIIIFQSQGPQDFYEVSFIVDYSDRTGIRKTSTAYVVVSEESGKLQVFEFYGM